MASFVRKVPTASGARAVQIVHKQGRRVVRVDHIGSAHDDGELAVLTAVAHERLQQQGQQTLPFDVTDQDSREGTGGARVVASSSKVLWDVLGRVYEVLGFDAVGDASFRALVLARVVEPTSKADTVRVLAELGVPGPSLRTIFRTLQRCVQRDYRHTLATAAMAHSSRRATSSSAAMVLYDVTSLYFEIDKEDDLRKVGMSKERRVDPQIQVGLLVDPDGFPLEVHCFAGNRAETTTLIPVLTAFQERHGVTDMVVVADAGMLSAANLNDLEDAGFKFIVGSRITKAPYDLAEYFEQHGNYIPPDGPDGARILESSRVMGSGTHARTRRVVYQYSLARQRRDDRAIKAMLERAEKIAAGTRAVKKDRFVSLSSGEKPVVNWALVERARQLAGLKGYVTNLSVDSLTGTAVVKAYHDLWQVEKSFRMAKSNLRARPIFHHLNDSIQAHLTVVFAALAISRQLQDATGLSIKRVVRTLRPLRTIEITIAGHQITAAPTISPEAAEILAAIRG